MVDTFQPRSLSCFRIRKRRHDNKMNLQNKKAPKTLNVTWAEERSELLCSFQSPGMFFLLTLPFIERVFGIDGGLHVVGRKEALSGAHESHFRLRVPVRFFQRTGHSAGVDGAER